MGGESTQTPIHITGIPHLATPPTEALGWSAASWNVKWDGSKATWDSVPNATGYDVYLYNESGSLHMIYKNQN